jgi:hypothetical protein
MVKVLVNSSLQTILGALISIEETIRSLPKLTGLSLSRPYGSSVVFPDGSSEINAWQPELRSCPLASLDTMKKTASMGIKSPLRIHSNPIECTIKSSKAHFLFVLGNFFLEFENALNGFSDWFGSFFQQGFLLVTDLPQLLNFFIGWFLIFGW